MYDCTNTSNSSRSWAICWQYSCCFCCASISKSRISFLSSFPSFIVCRDNDSLYISNSSTKDINCSWDCALAASRAWTVTVSFLWINCSSVRCFSDSLKFSFDDWMMFLASSLYTVNSWESVVNCSCNCVFIVSSSFLVSFTAARSLIVVFRVDLDTPALSSVDSFNNWNSLVRTINWSRSCWFSLSNSV